MQARKVRMALIPTFLSRVWLEWDLQSYWHEVINTKGCSMLWIKWVCSYRASRLHKHFSKARQT